MGLPFTKWVNERVDERHFKVAEERDLLIEMDPEIGDIYKASQAVSGKCSLLISFSALVTCNLCDFLLIAHFFLVYSLER